jgi:hypothetical protein
MAAFEHEVSEQSHAELVVLSIIRHILFLGVVAVSIDARSFPIAMAQQRQLSVLSVTTSYTFPREFSRSTGE